MNIGARYDRKTGVTEFTVWSPFSGTVAVRVLEPQGRVAAMTKNERGYWTSIVPDVPPGTRYLYRIDDERERPDPASRHQPEGVHGPSAVVDHGSFSWTDKAWRGMPLPEYIIYELHPGTFTREGTFDAVIPRLSDLADLGITAIELMPVAQFPGSRNWGYDGVYPFAIQNTYGGPEGLKRLVDACHARGMAVVLDVVYNHLGPEGNYLGEFGPYFTDKYRTPWGPAINFDGAWSNDVRGYFIASALAHIRDYHIDALRIDAIHGIFDAGARHFLQELGEAVHAAGEEAGRSVFVIPESDLNDSRVISPREIGGYGLDAQWNDDFHHSLHTLITGERQGYYLDFGGLNDLVKAYGEGFVYSGQYSVFRKRNHGSPTLDRPAHQFVVFSQNHDQVGNRMRGERLAAMVSFEALKLAAACVLLSPNLPLLFMGEEYGEPAPFLYFVSHGDPVLIEAVRKGRQDEFKAFSWEGATPDPQDEDTFSRSRLSWSLRGSVNHAALLAYYRRLIALRKQTPPLATLSKEHMEVLGMEEARAVLLRRWSADGGSQVVSVFSFSRDDVMMKPPIPEGRWNKLIDSAEVEWNGPGTFLPNSLETGDEVVFRAMSAVVFERERGMA